MAYQHAKFWWNWVNAATLGISDIETIPVTLEEIFLAFYGKGNGGNHA